MDNTKKKLQVYSKEILQMEEMKRLNIPIEADLHKQIKVRVAEQGITVAQFVREAISEKLEKENAKGE
jgi:predicted HicB family RNase H-like nuclease